MENVKDTLDQRGERYGSFVAVADLSQQLQNVMQSSPNWIAIAHDQREALQAISSKIARALCGDPEYTDNWHDISGYAQLVEHRLLRDQQQRYGWMPDAVSDAAVKDAYKEYTLQEVIGGEQLPDWAGWVAVDKSGDVHMHECKPSPGEDIWSSPRGYYHFLKELAPPLNFKNCIWEINK